MKTIYLCGGINNLSDAEAKDWREYVKEELKGKYEFLDPMRRDYRGKEDDNVANIVHGDYDDINNSDIVLALCNKPSWGTAMEIHYAYTNDQGGGLKVIVVSDGERISPWLRYHSHEIIKTIQEAVQKLKEQYDNENRVVDVYSTSSAN